jgi:DUF1009 family protein
MVLNDSSAVLVATPEVDLRIRIPLVGCQTIPPHRLCMVLDDPGAVRVAKPEVDLRIRIPLVCGQTIPPQTL